MIYDVFEKYALPLNELGATVFALLYGYPLPSYENIFRGSLGLQAIGTNSLFSTGKTADPSATTVIQPSVDTIYSATLRSF